MAPLGLRGNALVGDCISVFRCVCDSCAVAAPGPLPKAGTEPTCLEAADDGGEADPSGFEGTEVGVSVPVVEDLSETLVAAPGPPATAGTEPT